VIDSTCGRSLDGGITWSASGEPAYQGYDQAAGGLCGGLTGHLAADPEGRIFLPKGHCGHPWISISADDGTTWTRVQVSTMTSMYTHTSVASDSAGNLYYVWIGDNQLPYLATSTDHGLTWSQPTMVAPPGVAQVNFPVIDAGDPGNVAISFPSTTTTDKSRAWDQTVVVSTDALDGAAPVSAAAADCGTSSTSTSRRTASCGPRRRTTASTRATRGPCRRRTSATGWPSRRSAGHCSVPRRPDRRHLRP